MVQQNPHNPVGPAAPPHPSGILVLNKPAGASSNQALTRIKCLFPRGRCPKLGHAGTLDPFATGVLLVLVGRNATKRSEELMGQEKRYLATVKLGCTTATLDPVWNEEPFEESLPLKHPQEVIGQFIGPILQTPPAFSALKRGGKPAYEWAKRGREIELEPRPVTVYSIDLISYDYPFMKLDVRCGRGTYIRALARDIAWAMGSAGYLTELKRTSVGDYTLDDSIHLDALTMDELRNRLK